MTMFVKVKPAEIRTGRTKPKISIPHVQNIEELVLLDALIKAVQVELEKRKVEVDERVFSEFALRKGTAQRPKSFKTVCDENIVSPTTSLEVRKRSNASPLTEREAEILIANGIRPREEVVIPFLFAINPKYVVNKKLLGKVEKALKSAGVKDDFIIQQQEVKKLVVSDEMLDYAFKNSKPNSILRMLVTLAIKPELSPAYDTSKLFDDAARILKNGQTKVKPSTSKKHRHVFTGSHKQVLKKVSSTKESHRKT